MKYSHEILLTLVCCSLLLSLQAQQATRPVFHSYNSIQLLNGSSVTSAALQSVNGWQYNRFFAGAGAGADFYYQSSIPVFAEIRYDITAGSRRVQLYADGGIHLPAGNTNRQQPAKTGDFKTGRLLAAGVDYFIPYKKRAVVAGIGFSQKRITQIADNFVWDPVIGAIHNIPVKERYEFNRIAIKLGLVF